MKKNKKKIIIIVSTILVVVIVGLSLVKLSEFKKKEEIKNTYNEATKDIENKDFEKALDLLNEIIEYKDSKDLIIEAKYLYAINLYENKNFDKSEQLFVELGNYKNSSDLITEVKYLKAMDLSSNNQTHLEAIQIFNGIISYKDSEEMVKTLKNKHLYDGTWKAVNEYGSDWTWIINGEYCYLIALYDSAIKYNCAYGDTIKLYSGDYFAYEFTISGENLKYIWDRQIGMPNYTPHRGSYWTMSKVSNSVTLPKQKTDPTIGMTKEEVQNSTWGSPERINKTTTIYGTKEQWVYSLTRYVYFNEDGIVYSIQQ